MQDWSPVPVESVGGRRIQDRTPADEDDLVEVKGWEDRPVRLHHLAAEAWGHVVAAARAADIDAPLLLVTSGHRSLAHQAELWGRGLAKYGDAALARRWTAPPGTSAHQTGRALDCWLGSINNSSNVELQRTTAAWLWLDANAAQFGFYPYEHEPWHWEYNPPEVA